MKAINWAESFDCSSVPLVFQGRITRSPFVITACGRLRHKVVYRYPSSERYPLDGMPAINKHYSGAVIYYCNNSEEVDHV
ncbi:hypothetical protein DHU18_05805 [Salmonella enterica]|nr:hypothetical protein [Salmonella enterica]EAR5802162.1 hypothetical protein [Salmonella enterica]EBI5623446.1 hypothetical protein [Salmonella enterica]EBO3987073.1 hypothetical protein [Salmonella enterica]ECU0900646.1 hypothetical protein [Salmonella enterica]